MTVTYTGTVAPSAELVPGFSGDNRDLALIDNGLTIDQFRSAPAGGGLLFDDPVTTRAAGVRLHAVAVDPVRCRVRRQLDLAVRHDRARSAVTARNGAPPLGLNSGTLLTTGYPPDPTVGVGHDATLTVVLSPNLRYVAGHGRGRAAPALPDPTTSLDAGTSVQTLVFHLGDFKQAQAVHRRLRRPDRSAFGVQGGMTARLTMNDATGSPSRGTAVPGATYVYQHALVAWLRAGEPAAHPQVPRAERRLRRARRRSRSVRPSRGPAASSAAARRTTTARSSTRCPPASTTRRARPCSTSAPVARTRRSWCRRPTATSTEVVTPLPDGRTELQLHLTGVRRRSSR